MSINAGLLLQHVSFERCWVFGTGHTLGASRLSSIARARSYAYVRTQHASRGTKSESPLEFPVAEHHPHDTPRCLYLAKAYFVVWEYSVASLTCQLCTTRNAEGRRNESDKGKLLAFAVTTEHKRRLEHRKQLLDAYEKERETREQRALVSMGCMLSRTQNRHISEENNQSRHASEETRKQT
jgi:hypothetical protein